MTFTMDGADLRAFAAAVVKHHARLVAEMASQAARGEGHEFENAPFDYRWGRVVDRALGDMPS